MPAGDMPTTNPLREGKVELVEILDITVEVAVRLNEAQDTPIVGIAVTACKNTLSLAEVIAVVEALNVVLEAAKNPDAALPKAAGLELDEPTEAVVNVAADTLPVVVPLPKFVESTNFKFPVVEALPLELILPLESTVNWFVLPTFRPPVKLVK